MKHFVSYQREVDKGKLTAVVSFGKVTFRASKLATADNFPLSTSRW